MDKSSEESLIKEIITNPRNIMAHGNLGNLYFNEERYDEAIEAYQKVIEIDPKQVAAYNNLGNVYAKQERYNEAIEVYQKTIELNPEQIAEYNNLIDKYKRILQKKNKKNPLRFFRNLFGVFRK